MDFRKVSSHPFSSPLFPAVVFDSILITICSLLLLTSSGYVVSRYNYISRQFSIYVCAKQKLLTQLQVVPSVRFANPMCNFPSGPENENSFDTAAGSGC